MFYSFCFEHKRKLASCKHCRTQILGYPILIFKSSSLYFRYKDMSVNYNLLVQMKTVKRANWRFCYLRFLSVKLKTSCVLRKNFSTPLDSIWLLRERHHCTALLLRLFHLHCGSFRIVNVITKLKLRFIKIKTTVYWWYVTSM